MESEQTLKDDSQEKSREWSAVKTQATPDKALVFCPLHAEPDPKSGRVCGPKNNLRHKCATYNCRKRDRKRQKAVEENVYIMFICLFIFANCTENKVSNVI